MRSPRLGLPVMPRTVGQGINPGAPDPQGMIGPQLPQGPGLGLEQDIAPAAPQPQMQMPTGDPNDLSDLNGASKIGLLLGNVAAGLQGNMANSPVMQMQQQRRQEYERKRQAFMQGIQMMEKMDKDLESIPFSQRQAKMASQRATLVKIGGDGWGQTYDSLMGDDTTRTAMLEAMKTDEGWKAIMAVQDPTPKDFSEYQRTRREKVVNDYDRAQTAPAIATFMKLVESDPKARAEVKEMAKDGFTNAEIRAINDKYGTMGPQGVKLTEAQLGTFDRQQDMLVGQIPGYVTDETYAKDQERAKNTAAAKEIEEHKQRMELQYNTTQPKTDPPKPEGFGLRATNTSFAKEVYTPMVTGGGFAESAKSAATLNAVINQLGTEVRDADGNVTGFKPNPKAPVGKSRALVPDGKMGRAIAPETAAMEQAVRSVVAANLKLLYGSQPTDKDAELLFTTSFDPVLGPEENYRKLDAMRTRIQREFAAKKAAATYFESNGNSLEHYSGVAELEKQLGDLDASRKAAEGGEARNYEVKQADGTTRTVRAIKQADGSLKVVK